jgi:TM2 domain-containing membrane protein YozV
MNQMPPPSSSGNSKRVSAGILGILLGALGIHKFVLGYSKAGVIMLLVSIIGAAFFFLGPIVMGTIGLIEGIIYLTKSDAEFYNTYVANKKEWF